MTGMLLSTAALFCAMTYYVHFHVESPIDVNKRFELPDRRPLDGLLDPTWHDNLTGAVHLFENEIHGPECLELASDGSIFTGTADGEILRIKNDKIVNRWRLPGAVTSVGCGTYETEPVCGRPLGLRLIPGSGDKELIVIDAYLGIFYFNIETGKGEELVPAKAIVDGRPIMFPNDLVIVDDNTIIFTDSSSKYTRRQFFAEFLELQPNGRLLQLDRESMKVKMLVDELIFPNGVTLSKDKSHVFVAETGRMRILRHYIAGVDAGKTEVFFDNLPGAPDNIRLQENGDIWVPIAKMRSFITDFLDHAAWLRNHIAKIVPIPYMNLLIQGDPTYGFIVVIDSSEKNKILDSYQDPSSGSLKGLSHALKVGDHVYLGSFKAPYLGKVKLAK